MILKRKNHREASWGTKHRVVAKTVFFIYSNIRLQRTKPKSIYRYYGSWSTNKEIIDINISGIGIKISVYNYSTFTNAPVFPKQNLARVYVIIK